MLRTSVVRVTAWSCRGQKNITDRGGLRSQFHHVIDIAPTILEVAGIPEPRMVNGVPQKPVEGLSMAYTFADQDAPGHRVTQYFEMFGNRALYHDGWGCRLSAWQAALGDRRKRKLR